MGWRRLDGERQCDPMHSVTGGSLPAEIWKAVMLKAQEGLLAQPLPGTEMDAALAKKAAEALGLDNLPARNPFRRREVSDARKEEEKQASSSGRKAAAPELRKPEKKG